MKLYDENLWSKANQENKDILEDYELELESRGRAKKTIEQYMFDLRGFVCWIAKNRKDQSMLKLKRRDFRKLFLDMAKQGASNARINRFQSSLRNCLQYCYEEESYEDYNDNIMNKIHGLQKESVHDIIFLTDQEVNQVLDYFMRKADYQKALCFSFVYDNACRRNECLEITKDTFDGERISNEVVGKRAKRFKLVYSKRTKIIANIYFKQRGEDDCNAVWVKKDSQGKVVPLSYSTLYDWATECRKAIPNKEDVESLTFHSWRHSSLENFSNGTHHFLKELNTKSLDIDELKTIAHHTDISTTKSYLKDHDLEKVENIFGVKMD